MDQDQFNERVVRLQELGKIIEQLPSEIRSNAFELLKDYISPTTAQSNPSRDLSHAPAVETVSTAGTDLFTKFDHDKPSDNARLIAAYFFQEYGSEPFSVDDVKDVAAKVGITIPERVDMTLGNAFENGKQLFSRVGRGKFKPTVHGEAYLKTTYEVKKGTRTRSSEDE